MVWKTNTLKLELNYWQMMCNILDDRTPQYTRETMVIGNSEVLFYLPILSLPHTITQDSDLFPLDVWCVQQTVLYLIRWMMIQMWMNINCGVCVSYIYIPMYNQRGPVSNKLNPLFIFPWVLMKIYFENLFFSFIFSSSRHWGF